MGWIHLLSTVYLFLMSWYFRAQDKTCKNNLNGHFLYYSSPNPMFDHLLESSQWDDSNKCSNVGFWEEICILEIKYAPYLAPCIYESAKFNWWHVDSKPLPLSNFAFYHFLLSSVEIWNLIFAAQSQKINNTSN